MSRQFRFYLLPSEIESFTAELRSRIEMKIYRQDSETAEPAEVVSPLRSGIAPGTGAVAEVYCLLAPVTANIRMRYYPKRSEWLVHEEASEVVQFCGCRFDGKMLAIGRFYTQTDMLIGDTIWRKEQEFLAWADRLYRAAKKLLPYSKELEA